MGVARSGVSIASDGRIAAAVLLATLAAIAGLAVLGLVLDAPLQSRLFSESGPFEIASEWLWVLLGAACLAIAGCPWRRRLLLSALALVLAMREADWHKAFTADSIFKSNYYQDMPAPLAEKLLAGAVALACILGLVWAGVLAWRSLIRDRNLREPWGLVVALGIVLLPLVKIVDRSHSILVERHGIAMPAAVERMLAPVEEGTEMLLPLILASGLWLYRRQERRMPRTSQPGQGQSAEPSPGA
jgi:hypothetical protein